IVRFEYQPALRSRETVPLIPISFKVIAVSVGWSAMNMNKHGQILRLESSWRIHQHAFNTRSVVGGPLVWLRHGQIAFGEQLVERRDWASLLNIRHAVGQIHLSRVLDG